MDPRLQAQLDVRQQAEHLHSYMKDLTGWQKEVKQKEKNTRQQKPKVLPPVRGQRGPVNILPAAVPGVAAEAAAVEGPNSSGSASRHPAAHTYDHYRDKWDKFDVDAALASNDESETVQAGNRKVRSSPVDIPAVRPKAAQLSSHGASSIKPRAQQQAADGSHVKTASGTPAQPTTADELKEEGNRLFKSGNFAKAVACYTSSLDISPTCLAYANRAMARLKLKEFSMAEADCSKALQLDSKYVKAYQRRASARKEMGDLQGSIDDLESVLRWETSNKAAAAELQDCISKLLDQQGLVWPDAKESIPVRHAEPSSAVQPVATRDARSSAAVAWPTQNVAGGAVSPTIQRATHAEDGQVLLKASSTKRLDASSSSFAVKEALIHAEAEPPSSVAVISAAAAHLAVEGAVVNIDDTSLPPLEDPQESDTTRIQTASSQSAPAARQLTGLAASARSTDPANQSVQMGAAPAGSPAASTPDQPVLGKKANLALNGKDSTVVQGAQPTQQGAPAEALHAGAQEAKAASAMVSTTASTTAQARQPAPGASKAPRNGLEFERGWKSCKGHAALQSEYLRLIPPPKLPAILKQSLTPVLLVSVMLTLLRTTVEQAPSHTVAMLETLPSVPRFDMNLLSVPGKEKQRVTEAWDHAQATLGAHAEAREELVSRLEIIRGRYKL